jgi:predicted PurR-regulated permease PerM
MNATKTKPEKALISPLHLGTLFTMMFMAIGIYLCYRMIVPFFSILTWTITLTVLFSPLQRQLESFFKYRTIAALISTFLIGLLVIVPIIFLIQKLVMQVISSASLVENLVDSGDWRRHLESQPNLARYFYKIEPYLDLPNLVKVVNAWLVTNSANFLKNSALNVLSISLIFYLLFFFLRDRYSTLTALEVLSPLGRWEMKRLFQIQANTIKAIVYGTLSIAMIQGFLGGLMFWWLDLPAPLIWGVIMALLSQIPMFGTFIVWMPAAAYLMLLGDWKGALTLTLWGVLVISTIDNLLRPYLVGNKLHLHTILIFFSIIGGVVVYGPSGLILGPVTFTSTRYLLEIWNSHKITKKTE